MPDEIYLDANALIYPVLYDGPQAAGARDLLRAVDDGGYTAATSCLTIDEVVWILSRHTDRSTAIAQGRRLFSWPPLQLLDVGELTVRSMLDHLDAHEALTPRDATHLAAMTEAGLETIVSADADFDAVDGIDRVEPRAYASG